MNRLPLENLAAEGNDVKVTPRAELRKPAAKAVDSCDGKFLPMR